MSIAYGFTGTIVTVTRDGRSGIVKLDEEIQGRLQAVISPETHGRIPLMNKTGRLEVGEQVIGTGEIGSEALRAMSIDRIEDAGRLRAPPR